MKRLFRDAPSSEKKAVQKIGSNALTSAQMRRLDSLNINKCGIPSALLMERAGRAAAARVLQAMKRLKPGGSTAKAAVFCGRGNNGGDGLVCARYLISQGLRTEIYLLPGSKPLTADAYINNLILEKQGRPVYKIRHASGLKGLKRPLKADIIVDSIFGTGFKGEPRGVYAEAIEFINTQEAYIISVDVPSGLDATAGTAKGPAVIADQTVTFGFAKKGFYKNDGPVYCGKIKVADIGLRPFAEARG